MKKRMIQRIGAAAICAGILGVVPIGEPLQGLSKALSGNQAAWAQEGTVLPEPGKVDRSIPGSSTGILLMAKEGKVQIDRATYPLAAGVLIEDHKGQSLSVTDLHYEGGAPEVQFWLGTDNTRNQIVQIVVTFPQ